MDHTNAERQARWRQRQKERIEAALRNGDAGATAAAELARAKARIAELTGENIALRRQLAARQKPQNPRPAKPPETAVEPDSEVAALQRQLNAARTRIRNLAREKTTAWEDAKAKPAMISKRDHTTLRKVFHPDAEAGVSEERKRLLTRAAQIFNRLEVRVIDGRSDEA